MFTQTSKPGLRDRVLRSPLLSVLTGPHGVSGYTELVDEAWTAREPRARVVQVRRTTLRSVTLTLEPNRRCAQLFADFRAGGFVTVSVEIDGRRYRRCYSPANAEGAAQIELTIGRHDGGVVSTYLYDHARPGMVVGLEGLGGEFTLPAQAPDRILFVSAGSGITPVMSMLRTLRERGHAGEIAFVHYARTAADACYAPELAEMTGVKVLHGYTRSDAGELTGYVDAEHLDTAMPNPDAVYVCGPAAVIDAVRARHPQAFAETFVPPAPAEVSDDAAGQVAFTDSGVTIDGDGRSLLEQAEDAGLSPENGCRMGICHTCTRKKTSGAVKNLVTGAISSTPDEDVQICVSAPVGDVEIAL